MKWTVKRMMSQIFLTNIGRILLSALLLVIGAFMAPDGAIGMYIYGHDEGIFWNWVMIIGVVGLLIHVLIAIVYAWIINPIKLYKENKKK